ncbi:MAG: hypothetical protein CVU13_03260 [Bacteroidetes bacterium HGW-Bacteroidetes-8]|jgi:predicted short-subunit dehydrogenase-like oxidoreductase (DUF2520 family)|nr:MAG: hypothetical protein CVU13_03260 [Bacteroidetes bacterium HGW-Bacteroidetes-8]
MSLWHNFLAGEDKMDKKSYRISFVGYGNLAYRLSMALKYSGMEIEYIFGRDLQETSKLAYILNKPENRLHSNQVETTATHNLATLAGSDIVILAVSDRSIGEVADALFSLSEFKSSSTTILHCSGASEASLLNNFKNSGVLYPLMTLSKTKPVDFSVVPFFLEYSNEQVKRELTNICFVLKSEYRVTDSQERLRLHLAAVYVSNFVNYLTGLAFDLAKPNQMFLMSLAIETIRKAFLYQHPSLVQTGPAKRGDIETLEKHLNLLKEYPEHKAVYEILSGFISQNRKLL